MPNLIKKIQNTCFQNNLFNRESKIIIAVSGGPDSVCMLDIFSKLQKKYSLELIVAHVNYNLRGTESEKDEQFVRKLAKDYNLEIFVKNVIVSKKDISENHFRDIRYVFFEKLRKDKDFDFVSVGHNLNDQVETFLMHLIRGSGLQGLSAMQFKNNCIIRPLLAVSRIEIKSYLKENKLKYRLDKTNLENKFFRNKIRNKLIPNLEKNFNPKIIQTIFNSIISIAEDLAFLSEITDKTFQKFSKLNILELKKLHPAIRKRVIRKAILTERGDLKNIKTAHMEEILKIINSGKNKSQVMKFENLKIIRKSDKLEISCDI